MLKIVLVKVALQYVTPTGVLKYAILLGQVVKRRRISIVNHTLHTASRT